MERGSGRLREMRFVRRPVVWIGGCVKAGCPRQPRGYLVYFRLSRPLPEREPGAGDIKFRIAAIADVAGVRGFDPMTRLGPRRYCYEHPVLIDERRTFTLDIGADDEPGIELPGPGGLVRVTVSTYQGDFEEQDFRIDGRLSAMVRVRPPEPPARATDYGKPDAQRAAGC